MASTSSAGSSIGSTLPSLRPLLPGSSPAPSLAGAGEVEGARADLLLPSRLPPGVLGAEALGWLSPSFASSAFSQSWKAASAPIQGSGRGSRDVLRRPSSPPEVEGLEAAAPRSLCVFASHIAFSRSISSSMDEHPAEPPLGEAAAAAGAAEGLPGTTGGRGEEVPLRREDFLLPLQVLTAPSAAVAPSCASRSCGSGDSEAVPVLCRG
mmetsp:Transcript_130079/g.290762  ORF Transcript_130079/g.290762 Transcript_130079/m.290762 type:complete len:209 (-) Transcript_130079:17-643(-)